MRSSINLSLGSVWRRGDMPLEPIKELRLKGGMVDDIPQHILQMGIVRPLLPQ